MPELHTPNMLNRPQFFVSDTEVNKSDNKSTATEPATAEIEKVLTKPASSQKNAKSSGIDKVLTLSSSHLTPPHYLLLS